MPQSKSGALLLSWLLCASARPAAARESKADAARAALGAKALGLLHRAMVDEDSDVRVMAAEQWGPIGNPAARPVLARALKDPSPYVRIAAAGSLLELGDAEGGKAVEAIALEAPKDSGAAGELGALEEMRRIARGKTRATALRALSRMDVPGSTQTLRRAAGDPDPAVRDAAEAGLARLGDAEAVERLLRALDSDDTQVRAKAADELADAASPDLAERLTPYAKDPAYAVRAAVMAALGATGSPLALPALVDGASDQNELVRSKAVAALGRLGQPGAIQYLEAARQQASNVYIELLAVAGLARLGEPVDTNPARRALYQPDADTRLLAVEVLEAAVERARAKRDAREEQAGLQDLETALDDAEARVRVRAAAALVRLLQKAPKEAR